MLQNMAFVAWDLPLDTDLMPLRFVFQNLSLVFWGSSKRIDMNFIQAVSVRVLASNSCVAPLTGKSAGDKTLGASMTHHFHRASGTGHQEKRT